MENVKDDYNECGAKGGCPYVPDIHKEYSFDESESIPSSRYKERPSGKEGLRQERENESQEGS